MADHKGKWTGIGALTATVDAGKIHQPIVENFGEIVVAFSGLNAEIGTVSATLSGTTLFSNFQHNSFQGGVATGVIDGFVGGVALTAYEMNTLYGGAAGGGGAGSPGPAGPVGIHWTFDTSTTTNADPGPGDIRFNNASFASVTELAVDDLSVFTGNPDVSAFVAAWDDSTNTVKGHLLIKKVDAPENFVVFNITSLTDQAGYTQIAVAYVASAGAMFGAGNELSVEFVRAGNVGAAGATGATGPNYLVKPQGRLSLATGIYFMSTTQSAKTTVYYVVNQGRMVPVFDGTNWVMKDTGGELSIALDSDTGHTGYQQVDKNYDIFYANVSGNYYFGTGPAWNDGAVAGSDTLRGTGASSTDLDFATQFPTNKNSITLRHGSVSGDTVTVPAGQATYLGSIRMTANGQTGFIYGSATNGGGEAKFFVFNAYNRLPITTNVQDNTASWTYATAAYRNANNSATNRINLVIGLAEVAIDARYYATSNAGSPSGSNTVAIGLDSTSVAAGFAASNGFIGNTANLAIVGLARVAPGIGLHFLTALEYATGTTATFFGSTNMGLSAVIHGM